jgi:hypothetical protein
VELRKQEMDKRDRERREFQVHAQ